VASILIVDPNVPFRRMMEQLLRQNGHEAFGANDAETAGLAMRDRPFELVVVELVLPGEMSGTEFLEWLRDFPAPGNPGRVALCSLASFANQEAYLKAELALEGFVVKPFKPSDFRKAIDGAIDSHKKRPKTGRAAPPAAVDPPSGKAPAFVAPPVDGAEVATLESKDLIPLDSNPGLVNAPAPSAREFETASGDAPVRLEQLAPPPSAVERRSVPRYAVRIPMAVHDGKSPFRARSENLGRSGVFVATDKPMPLGSSLRVRLELPIAGVGFAEIVSTVIHAGAAGFGVAFREMSPDTARRLDLFLEDLRRPSQTRPFLIVASAALGVELEQVAQAFRNEEVRVRALKPNDDPAAAADEEPPDLVLLDMSVPLTGQAVANLKASRSTSRIPVGLADRSRQPQVALAAAAAGADRFFLLPDDQDRLVKFSVDTLAASRRRGVRVRFTRPVTVVIDGKQILSAGVDLSETGVQVRMIATPKDGTIATVLLTLSDGGADLALASRVTWTAPAREGTKVGLVFEPEEDARGRIREEVRRALAVSYYVRWLAAAPKAKPKS
jgi:CheY-like chemotaxis protein